MEWVFASQETLTKSLPGLPGIISVVVYKIAGRHSLNYPLSFLSRYLERLVYLPLIPFFLALQGHSETLQHLEELG